MSVPWQTARGNALTTSERAWLKYAAEQVSVGGLIVNIGVLLCASMYCLRAGAPQARLIGVDIIPSWLPIHPDLKAEFLIADSRICHVEVKDPIDLLFIDGDHHYVGIRDDINNWTPKIPSAGLVIFHDYAPLPSDLVKNPQLEGVRRAVNEWHEATSWRRLKAPDSLAAFQKPRPFLSIVTRCYTSQRPKSLGINRASVAAQTDQDLEQVFIEDVVGIGIHGANVSLAENKDRVRGEYVLILDDDDRLTYDYFIRDLKAIVKRYDPDVVISKMLWKEGRILPPDAYWEKPPKGGRIGTNNFVVRRDVWLEYISAFGVPRGGDISFIKKLWDKGYKFFWWDEVTSSIQRIGYGRPEPKNV